MADICMITQTLLFFLKLIVFSEYNNLQKIKLVI